MDRRNDFLGIQRMKLLYKPGIVVREFLTRSRCQVRQNRMTLEKRPRRTVEQKKVV